MEPQSERNDQSRLHRSRQERILFGVCGGLAEHFNVDPTIVRVAFVVVALIPPVSALSLLGYPLLAVIMPSETTEQLPGRDAVRSNITELRGDVDDLATSLRSRVTGLTRGQRTADDAAMPAATAPPAEAPPAEAPATDRTAAAG